MHPGLITIHIRRGDSLPLFRQIYEKIRDDILTGRLTPGWRLPATRQLARELSVSRNVVLEAYAQLIAEGYVESRSGSYTRVTKNTCYKNYPPHPPKPPASPPSPPLPDISFQTGVPDLSCFPRAIWARYLKQSALNIRPEDLAYSSPQGLWELRRVLCDYLFRVKGIRVPARQVVITAGATQALALSAGILGAPGALALLEDPAGFGVIRILKAAGIAPLPAHFRTLTDKLRPQGTIPAATRLIYTTPSHQFPMGYILSAAQRIALLERVENRKIFIIEDDYDSEFRYEGAPIHPFKALAPEKVIYIGSFSKVLSPGLRLGYAVLPENLIQPFREKKQFTDAQSPVMEQAALEGLIRDGQFERHLFRMKKIYRQKRDTLVNALTELFGDRIRIFGENAGLHLVVQFPKDFLPRTAQPQMICNGVAVDTVEKHAIEKGRHTDKLIFGYGNLTCNEIVTGIRRLKDLR